MNIDRYPLTWPEGQPRTPTYRRGQAAFHTEFAKARDALLHSIDLLGGTQPIISCNVALRKDGLPYANMAEPNDPGVAVYFDRFHVDTGRKTYVLAADSFKKVKWNLRAIGLTVDSLRQMQRHGTRQLMERAFTGFLALPPAPVGEPWWNVLGIPRESTEAALRTRYKELILRAHPDKGGDPAVFRKITSAFAEALAEKNGENA